MKYFNVTGFCNPEWHYMINPLRHFENQIMDLIQNRYYFVIHAARQTGKTTLLHYLEKKLNAGDKYIALTFSVERAGFQSITENIANERIITSIHTNAKERLPVHYSPPQISDFKDKSLFDYLNAWSNLAEKPIVLFIDEIDALYDDVLVSMLRQLRDGFQLRPKGFPQSIVLVGLRDVRDYKLKAKYSDGSLGSGSPFNIKAESFHLQNFSIDEIRTLYAQFTEETGQKFSEPIIEIIYDLTGGQPWLTNALAREIVETILQKDFTKEITEEIVYQAKEILIQRRDTHLDSLLDKLNEERIKPIVQSIINGEELIYNNFNNDLLYCIDLGIVKKTKTGIGFANAIYKEIIPRVLNTVFQENMTYKVEPQWFIKPDGNLDMDILLKEFQEFYRENAESWINRFYYKESGQQLLLMAFLQRVINGGGSIDREMAIGSGRTDLLIGFNNERFVLELKIKHFVNTREKGLKQLSRYMDTLGLQHGYLILFEKQRSDIISWEQRIKWDETEYNNKNITVIEM